MAGDFEIKLDMRSYERLLANFVLLKEGVEHTESNHIVRDVMKSVMEEAIRRCPMETGRLRQSAHLEDVQMSTSKRTVAIVFGNDSVDYAIPVHEILDAHHPIGQAKYLESAINDHSHISTGLLTKIGSWLSVLAGRFRR